MPGRVPFREGTTVLPQFEPSSVPPAGGHPGPGPALPARPQEPVATPPVPAAGPALQGGRRPVPPEGEPSDAARLQTPSRPLAPAEGRAGTAADVLAQGSVPRRLGVILQGPVPTRPTGPAVIATTARPPQP